MLTKEEIGKIKVATLKSKSSLLFQTRYLFKKSQNKKFIVGDHHQQIANVLELVLKGELTKVMINIAPRYGKTELAVKNFVAHALALNASANFIHLSYSDDLALDNSEAIRDMVETEAYQQMFPHVQIKQDSDAKKKWYTTEGGGVYARAAGGQVTGFGAGKVDEEKTPEQIAEDEAAFMSELGGMLDDLNIKSGFNGALIIDDPIKPDDADSDTIRERINNRFNSTIRNRVNSRNTPIIIIMQRLHENDLCGYIMSQEAYTYDLEEALADKSKWYVLSIPVIKNYGEENAEALWPFKHTLKELLDMEEKFPIVFGRQYMMNPQPKEGYLYGLFKTYTPGFLPFSKKRMKKSHADTADTGKDYLCSIAYDELDTGMYVTDVIYTQEKMEVTEIQVAKQLAREEVERGFFESNNGGRGFARNVERELRLMGNTKTKIEWFHQGDNKDVRIFTKSADVMNMIYMPIGWETRWPKFYQSVKHYKAAGGNAHDDAEDCLTGMTEDFGAGYTVELEGMSKQELGFY